MNCLNPKEDHWPVLCEVRRHLDKAQVLRTLRPSTQQRKQVMEVAIILYLYVVGAVAQLFLAYLVIGLVPDEPFDGSKCVLNILLWPVMFPAFLLWSHLFNQGEK